MMGWVLRGQLLVATIAALVWIVSVPLAAQLQNERLADTGARVGVTTAVLVLHYFLLGSADLDWQAAASSAGLVDLGLVATVLGGPRLAWGGGFAVVGLVMAAAHVVS